MDRRGASLWAALGWGLACLLGPQAGGLLSARLGAPWLGELLLSLILCAALLAWLGRRGLGRALGLCRPKVPARRMLWYLPLGAIASANLWFGLGLRLPPGQAVPYVLTMGAAALLEELSFRGLLLRALEPQGTRAALWGSALAFGLCHLLNWTGGAPLGPVLLQVLYSAALGLLFGRLVLQSGSLLPGLLTHWVLNALWVCSAPALERPRNQALGCLGLCLLAVLYGLWLRPRLWKGERL